MKLKLITKVLTLCSKPEKQRERVPFTFNMFIHFYLVDRWLLSDRASKRNIFRRNKTHFGPL